MEIRVALSHKAARQLGLAKRRKLSPSKGPWLRDWRLEYLDHIPELGDCYLLMNCDTLMSWVIPAEDNEVAQFQRIIYAIIEKGCEMNGLDRPATYQIEMIQINDRSAIGSMKDLIDHIHFEVEGLLRENREVNLERLEQRIQYIPMGAINYGFPIEKFNQSWQELGITGVIE